MTNVQGLEQCIICGTIHDEDMKCPKCADDKRKERTTPKYPPFGQPFEYVPGDPEW